MISRFPPCDNPLPALPERDDDSSDLITETELRAAGLTPADVKRLCPWATEYCALDGTPCWQLEDLVALIEKRGGR
jgi:hypothetical protein